MTTPYDKTLSAKITFCSVNAFDYLFHCKEGAVEILAHRGMARNLAFLTHWVTWSVILAMAVIN